jgi:DNA-binding beta-propeller fold protein YncE
MRLINLILILLLLVGCTKKPIKPNGNNLSEFSNGFLVLNEGLFNLNNASLSWIDLTSNQVSEDVFLSKTGRKLGDTGNDLQCYGNKLYVIVNVSSTLEVLDAKTGNSIKQISMQLNGKAKQPRNIVFQDGKAYISCFDGYIDVLDTSTLQIQKRIKVGDNPENMLVIKDRLYVSNSGGLNTNLDSTLSVIDCNSNLEISKILVGKNPGKIVAQNDTTIYVHIRGNYTTHPSFLKKIYLGSFVSQSTLANNITGIEKMDEYLLLFSTNAIALFDMQTNSILNASFISPTDIKTIYRIQYVEALKQIFVYDANYYTNSGFLHRFTNTGQFIQKYHVGLNPNSLIYYE